MTTHLGLRRALSQPPSPTMLRLAAEAVRTRLIPPALRAEPATNTLMAVAYVCFLDELMKAGVDIHRTPKAILATHHERAWQRAEAMLTEAGIALPIGPAPVKH